MGNMSGSYGSHYTLWLDVKTNSQNIAENYSNVTVNLYLQFDGSSYYAYTNNATSGNIVVDGLNNGYSISSINFSSGVKKDLLLASWTGNVGHNSDGTKSLTVSGSWNTNTSRIGSGSVSTTINLTKINRYAKFTEFYISGKTVNSISYAWNTDAACDANQYSLNGGAWQNGNWPYFTINGLSPNTKYSLKIRSKRTDSQLWTESSTIYETTYDVARLKSATNFNDEANPVITYNNPSGNLLTKLEACISLNSSADDIKYREISKTGTSYTFALTEDERNILRYATQNSNNLNVIFFVRSTMGSNTYYSTLNATMNIINANPIFSDFTYKDTDEYIVWLTGNNQTILKGYSNIEATISSANKAISKKGATMKTYKLDIGSESAEGSYSNNSDVSLQTYNVSSNVIQVRATDSRGNTTKVEKTVTNYKEYFPINILSTSATRENNVGETVILNFKAKFWNQSFGAVANTIKSCIYKYKKTSESAYKDGKTTLTYTINGNELTGTLVIEGDTNNKGFDISETYNIQLYIEDELTEKSYTITLGSGNPAIAIYKNRVAIGQKYDESKGDSLQVRDSMLISGELYDFVMGGGNGDYVWADIRNHNTNEMLNNFLLELNRLYTGKNFKAAGDIEAGGELIAQCLTVNTVDTWIPVLSGGKFQHTLRKFGGSVESTNYPTNKDYLVTLDFLSWWNGAYDAGGASNLKACYQGTIQAKPVILYGNASGTAGDITLSDYCENYDVVEVIFGKNGKFFNSSRCSAVSGRIISLTTGVSLNNTDKQLQIRNISFSGKAVTNNSYGVVNFGSNNIATYNSNEIYIYKILGYK